MSQVDDSLFMLSVGGLLTGQFPLSVGGVRARRPMFVAVGSGAACFRQRRGVRARCGSLGLKLADASRRKKRNNPLLLPAFFAGRRAGRASPLLFRGCFPCVWPFRAHARCTNGLATSLAQWKLSRASSRAQPTVCEPRRPIFVAMGLGAARFPQRGEIRARCGSLGVKLADASRRDNPLLLPATFA